jgi:hypothetical protein
MWGQTWLLPHMMMPKKQLLIKKCMRQMAIDNDIKVINAKVKFPMKMKLFAMVFHYLHVAPDAPPSSLMDSIASPKVKTTEGEGIGARSLAYNTLGIKRRVGALGWD